jgi:replicative DNA helicase
MGLIQRTVEEIKLRKQRLEEGKINSIPTNFNRFSDDFIGVEQSTYYLVTAATKVGKTQVGSNLFIYQPLEYAFNNPDKLKIHYFYYNLEEPDTRVTERYISHLLYTMTEGQIRVNPSNLRSSNSNRPLSNNVVEMIDSESFQERLSFFEQSVSFSPTSNPTGIYKECVEYAESHGTIHKKKIMMKDDSVPHLPGEKPKMVEREVFDYYEPDNPDEYRVIFVDHIGLVSTERGMDLRETINKLSEYFVILRNRYKFTIVAIHQQAFFEGIDAYKLNKLKPEVANLADSKAVARDIDYCLGIFSPYKYELDSYMGYDITKLRDNIRFFQVLLNRNGTANGIIAMYFDGDVSFIEELPLPSDLTSLAKIYAYIQKLRSQPVIKKVFLVFKKRYGEYLYYFRKKWNRKIH